MNESRNPLRDAVFRGDLGEVKSVLGKENLIDDVDEDYRTALQHAVIDGRLEIAKFLIAEGADIDHQDSAGYSALHYAVQSGQAELATLLVWSGARVDSQDKHGNTPLWRAVFAYTDDDSIIRMMMEANADPDLANDHGVSPRELSLTKGDELF